MGHQFNSEYLIVRFEKKALELWLKYGYAQGRYFFRLSVVLDLGPTTSPLARGTKA